MVTKVKPSKYMSDFLVFYFNLEMKLERLYHSYMYCLGSLLSFVHSNVRFDRASFLFSEYVNCQ